ncbi:hypothetical protein [Salipaludibacillus sp. CF4.18]|uniref:hypothetical protein n=1 Tax=Salipaludibacillus sp. CF4.18 TaxID=3373081 RepID=UPI003EE73120
MNDGLVGAIIGYSPFGFHALQSYSPPVRDMDLESQDIISDHIHVRERTDSSIDTTSAYTVTYEILDKYDFTTNTQEVIANYNSSLKSSFYGVVSKQSDIATGVSILDKQMLDVLVRLDAGGI